MLSTETSAALAAREQSRAAPPQPAQLEVRVLRAFVMDGKPVKAGATLTLDARFARELATWNKVQLLQAKPAAAAAPAVQPKPAKAAAPAPQATKEN
jgi:hypothetical protein